MQQHSIATTRTAHFFSLGGPAGPEVRQVWIICHGYAQLADEFLSGFADLASPGTLLIAPEGTNYFYKKGLGGDPTANWMTRRHREAAIADNAAYLSAVYERVLADLPAHVQIVLFGFSQGATTLFRWLLHARPAFHHLVLWAGPPPEDGNYHGAAEYLQGKSLHFAYSHTDPLLTPERTAAVNDWLAQNGLTFTHHVFEGAHEVPPEALARVATAIGLV
jgi:predicted esterase